MEFLVESVNYFRYLHERTTTKAIKHLAASIEGLETFRQYNFVQTMSLTGKNTDADCGYCRYNCEAIKRNLARGVMGV